MRQFILIETQWHYRIATKYGFIPVTKKAKGFVRSYTYKHPDGYVIKCCTGCNADYAMGESKDGVGFHSYWSELEPFLKKLVGDGCDNG